MSTFIDLSVTVNESTPIYPGDPATKIEPAGRLEKDGFNDHFVSLGTHVGTHVDAPIHMLEAGKTLDQIAVDHFVGPGVLVKGFDLADVQAANIQPGDIVLFSTGMSEMYHESVYFEDYPAMSEEVATYLVSQKVRMVGVDTCSVDNQDGFPIHKILLGEEILLIENLTNLNDLVGEKFTVYALPLKLDVDGAPARVVAEIIS